MAPRLCARPMPSRTARVQLIMPPEVELGPLFFPLGALLLEEEPVERPADIVDEHVHPPGATLDPRGTMDWTESHLVTSVGTTAADAAPDFRASNGRLSRPGAASISADGGRACPSRAKGKARIARPMFDPPPVTMTLLPLRFSSIRWFPHSREWKCGIPMSPTPWSGRRRDTPVWPVMKSEAGEAKYTASAAASSGSPRRRAGTLERKALAGLRIGHGRRARDVGVSWYPRRQAIDLYAGCRAPLGRRGSA